MSKQLQIFLSHIKRVPCHSITARLRLADRKSPAMDDSCEYIEQGVVDSRQGAVFQLVVWALK
jgi:hypothetical protein